MKKRSPRKTHARRPAGSVRTTWDLAEAGTHPAAAPTRHFYSRDSLASALDVAVFRAEPLLFSSGTPAASGITGVSGTIVAENTYAIELAIKFKAGKRRVPNLRLIVARNGEELSKMVRAEAKHLTGLAPRLKNSVPAVQQSGTLLLPERHQKKPQSRRIAAYATAALHDSVYCGIGQRDQLLAYTESPRLLSLDATDAVKQHVFELCLHSFDPRTHTAMPPPDLLRGAMRLSARDLAQGRIVLCGCPFLWDHIDPVSLLHRLTGFDWKEGNRQMPLLPADHALLRDALIAALGKAAAREWTRDYVTALENGRYKPHHRFTISEATQLRDSLR